jgi:hypothetical protein
MQATPIPSGTTPDRPGHVPATRYLSLKECARAHPAFTEAGLRWLRFNQGINGFERAFLRVGRKVVVDEAAFLEAVRRQGAAK